MHIKEYLEKERISMSEFARTLGVKPQFFWLIVKKGRKPPLDVAQRIVGITEGQCTLEELIPNRVPICPCCGRRLPKKIKVKL